MKENLFFVLKVAIGVAVASLLIIPLVSRFVPFGAPKAA